jgi:hypothetical protein
MICWMGISLWTGKLMGFLMVEYVFGGDIKVLFAETGCKLFYSCLLRI